MAEQIEVEAIKDARDWESDDKKIQLTFYTLDIKKADGQLEEVDYSRKQGGPEPQPGEKLDVVFEGGRYRRKMKKAPREGFKGGGEKSPQVQAQIIRQHSQEMALRFLSSPLGGRVSCDTVDEAEAALSHWANWFDEDVRQAGQRATGSVGASQGSPSEAVRTPTSQSPSADGPSLKQLEFLEKLAKENGFKDPELGTLMEWAKQTLTPGREGTCSEIIDKLKSGGIPEAERLKETSQNWANQRSEFPADTTGLSDQVVDEGSDVPF